MPIKRLLSENIDQKMREIFVPFPLIVLLFFFYQIGLDYLQVNVIQSRVIPFQFKKPYALFTQFYVNCTKWRWFITYVEALHFIGKIHDSSWKWDISSAVYLY